MKRLWVILLFSCPLIGQSKICQYDGKTLLNTYQSKYESGKLAYKWTCSMKHEFWIVNQSSTTKIQGDNKFSSPSSSLNSFLDNSFPALIENQLNAEKQSQAERERLEQEERIALAQMTPEQRQEYFKLKEKSINSRTKKININNEVLKKENTCIAIGLTGILILTIMEANRVGNI
jgi:hypothetical protein